MYLSHKSEQNRIPRRDFLRAGLIVPLSLTPLAEMLTAPIVSAQASQSPFVVGYQASEGVPVVNASQIRQGDALFQRMGVHVRIAGFHPDGQLATKSENKMMGAHLVFIRSFVHFYPAISGQPVILVPAWSSEVQTLPMGGAVVNLAAPVCMTVPLCPDGSLTFSISIGRADSVTTTRVIRLTTERGQDAKLLQGTYCIAVGKRGSTAAEWNALAWQNVLNENAAPLQYDTENSDAESRDAPDFPYLVVRVEPAANALPLSIGTRKNQ